MLKDLVDTTLPTPVSLQYILRRRLDTLLNMSEKQAFMYPVNNCLITIAGLQKHKSINTHVIKKGKQTIAFLEYLESLGFKHLYVDGPVGHRLGLFDSGKGVFSCTIDLDNRGADHGYSDLVISGVKNDPHIEMVVEWIKAQGPAPEFFSIHLYRRAKSRGSEISAEVYVQEVSKQKLARNVFYPYFKRSIDDICESFIKSDSPVMVLLGPPGCGKSTFMRTLAAKMKGVVLLTYDPEVMQEPEFLASYYRSVKSSLCIVEDIDILLFGRATGNNFMSTLLNNTEGVMKNGKKKVVLSTNLPSVTKIDPALIRTGRCFDVLTFRELTSDEAQAVSVEMKGDARQWDSQKSWSLSDVLNPTQEGLEEFSNEIRKQKKVGF